jgi:integrase
VRVGNWLTAEEGKKLLGAEIADTLRSRRNRALLSLLIGCGLRRAEVTTLRLEDLQLREGHLVIADLRGKGGHLIGQFPHEKIAGDKVTPYVHPDNPNKMRGLNAEGQERHWIFEIHFVDRSRQIGGFYEELLTIG